MMKTWLFYSYDARGNSVVRKVQAPTRDAAIKEFDFIYGEDTPIDCVVESGYQYEG